MAGVAGYVNSVVLGFFHIPVSHMTGAVSRTGVDLAEQRGEFWSSLMIIGGFSLATWLSEKLSNEVASRTRLTNNRIAERFAKLAHRQIGMTSEWLAAQAPTLKELDEIEQRANQLQEASA